MHLQSILTLYEIIVKYAKAVLNPCMVNIAIIHLIAQLEVVKMSTDVFYMSTSQARTGTIFMKYMIYRVNIFTLSSLNKL